MKKTFFNKVLSIVSVFTLLFNTFYSPLLLLSTSLFTPTDAVAASPPDLEQYANDNAAWVEGNLGASKATYFEGDSVPYRLMLDGVSLSSHVLTIEWDTTKNGKHALDYITSFDRTVSPNPCDGVVGCGSPTYFPIPADSQVTDAGVAQVAGNFTIYGGTITSVSPYSYPDGTGFDGDKKARISITFTASQDNPVIAWGGHIATRSDWGQEGSAINISGSPYHTRLIDVDGAGAGGNQDMSLSAEAVIFPADITIVKQADPEGSTEFNFTGDLGDFTLVDDGTASNSILFDEIIDFTTYDVIETVPAGWNLDSVVCSDDSATDTTTATANIAVEEGESVSCTFNNSLQNGTLTVNKVTDPTDDPSEFPISASGTGTIFGEANRILTTTTPVTYEVTPGTYDVTEDTPDGWNQQSNTCSDVVVDPGEEESCTITNVKYGSIIVDKVTDPSESDQVFEFSLTGDSTDSAELTDTDTPHTLPNLLPGSYSLSEVPVEGWDLTDSYCENEIDPSDITLSAGQNLNCTFENTQRGSILGYKYEDQDGDINTTGDWSAVENWIIELWRFIEDSFEYEDETTTDSSGFYEFTNLLTGSYELREQVDSGWESLTDETLGVTLDPGESDEENNFTNTQMGSIRVLKDADTDGDGVVDIPGSTDWTWKLGDDEYTTGDPAVSVSPDNYTISEVQEDGYHVVSLECSGEDPFGAATEATVSVSSGEDVVCTFTNARDTGSLLVNKIIDADGDTQTTDDQTLGESWQFDVDGESEDTSDPVVQSTDVSGSTTFTSLKTGDYTVIETPQTGYDLIDAYCDSGQFDSQNNQVEGVSVSDGGQTSCTFINSPNGVLHGRKWNDSNFDGELVGETLLSGWTINLYKYDEGEDDYLLEDTFVTDDGDHLGWYWFENLFPGDYKICEELKTGWEQTYPTDNDGCYLVNLPSGSSFPVVNEDVLENRVIGPAYDFGNVEYGSVQVTKYSDDNGSGQRDEGEITLSGWTMNLGELSDSTGEGGQVLFENLLPGFYTLSENQQEGWEFTGISCDSGNQGEIDNQYFVEVNQGETTRCEVGNQQQQPEVSIDKTNDSPTSSAGSRVGYTLTVTNNGNTPLVNINVFDVLPGEFTYVSGSTSGASEPTLTGTASDGSGGKLTWNDVGDLGLGESLTITYQAEIADDAADATYTNIATCEVLSRQETEIECNVVTSDVTLGTTLGFSASVGGQVLGAATELPAAGSNTLLLYIFIGMIVGGLSLRVVAEDLEKEKKKNA